MCNYRNRICEIKIILIKNINILQGKEIKDNYLTKIKMIDNLLNNIRTDKIFDTFELKVTRYYKINQKDLEEFKNRLPTTKLPINGIEFISINQNLKNFYNEFQILNKIKDEFKIFKIKKIKFYYYSKNIFKYFIFTFFNKFKITSQRKN